MRPTKAILRSARSAGTLTQPQYEAAILSIVRRLPTVRVAELLNLSEQTVNTLVEEVKASLKG